MTSWQFKKRTNCRSQCLLLHGWMIYRSYYNSLNKYRLKNQKPQEPVPPYMIFNSTSKFNRKRWENVLNKLKFNFNWLPRISIFNNSGHLGYRIGVSDKILKVTYLNIFPVSWFVLWTMAAEEDDFNAMF